ncbi:unnamed protein product [Malus baccata var. baccata]
MKLRKGANGGQNELGVRIGDQEIPKSDRFRYLGSILQKNGELDGDLNHIIQMRENRLRWFGHVQRRPTDAPIRRCDYETEVQGRRGRGRPRKTLEETLRKNLEYLDLTKDMTQD